MQEQQVSECATSLQLKRASSERVCFYARATSDLESERATTIELKRATSECVTMQEQQLSGCATKLQLKEHQVSERVSTQVQQVI